MDKTLIIVIVAAFALFFVMQDEPAPRIIVQEVPPPQSGSSPAKSTSWSDVLNNAITTGATIYGAARSGAKPGGNDLMMPKF